AGQVEVASEGAMSQFAVVYVIALGFAAFAAIGMARIVTGWPKRYVLATAYALVLALSLVAPAAFIPLAYDAGSVTTGVLSGPVMLALAIGLGSVLAGRSALSDGFGLVGLGSIGPIIAILLMGIVLAGAQSWSTRVAARPGEAHSRSRRPGRLFCSVSCYCPHCLGV